MSFLWCILEAMSRAPTALVFAMPFHGHVNPILGLLKTMASEGYRVVVFNTDDFAEQIRSTGAEFRSASQFNREFDPQLGHDILQLAELVLDLTEEVIPHVGDVIAEIQPDIILHDSYCLWAKLGAARAGIPAVALVTTLAFDYYVFMSYPRISAPQMAKLLLYPERLARVILRHRSLVHRYGAQYIEPADMFYNRERLNVVFTSRYFQPSGERFKEGFAFVGPSISARKDQQPELLDFPRRKPLVYVSLGTIFNQDMLFYRMVVEALADAGCNTLLSIGRKNNPDDIGSLPESVIVRQYVNQISVLERASVFVTHGGMNSVNESLYYGVPMVLFPVVQEQAINAERVAQLGAGIAMDRHTVTAEKLREAVVRVISERSYKEQAQVIGKTLREAGGEGLAFQLIKEIVNEQRRPQN